MPQEAWVLKCYSCKKFQVQLQKKSKKWQCKVCGSKQDLMTIFFKGQPSDCRNNCRNMNAEEGKMIEAQGFISQDHICNNENALQNNIYIDNNTKNCMPDHMNSLDNQFIQFEESDFEEDLKENKNISQENSDNQFIQFEESDFEEDFKENKNITQESSETTKKQSNIDDKINIIKTNDCEQDPQVLKLSIFESHSDFEELLDF